MSEQPDQNGDSPPETAAPDRASIARIKLTAFRNYGNLAVDFDERSVVLTGPNGAGKTNLLEAISFLSPGRGLRRASLDEVALRSGSGNWAVASDVRSRGDTVAIGTGLAMTPEGPERRRTIRIDHAPAKTADALLEHLNVIWLTPSMDGLFTGSAGDRRRFVDRAVLALDRRHGSRVNAFERAIRSRNRLLSEPPYDRGWADAIEIEIAELGVAVAAARREWADLMVALNNRIDPDGPFPVAELALEGVLETGLQERSASEMEAEYRRLLAEGRPRDTAAGRTLTGPHRSDLGVHHGPKQVEAAICSTGEQKALLVGLVLAQTRLVARMTGQTPVVLLDEIAAHLDDSRRSALFDLLSDLGCQAFMTGTDRAMFAALGERAGHYAVADAAMGGPEPI